MNFTLRLATVKDVPEIAALEGAVFGSHAYPQIVIRQFFDALPTLMIVAEAAGGDIVGYTTGALQTGLTDAWMLSLAVSKSVRRSGVAIALIDGLSGAAKELGAKTLKLTVMPSNHAARSAYEKGGFDFESEDPDYFGVGDGRIVLIKELG